MKAIHKILGLTAAMSVSLFSCDENDGIREANTTVANATSNTASFLLINATPDSPSLDLIVNGLKVGATVDLAKGQTGYVPVPITTPGTIVGQNNTSVRARATSGSIGGVLRANDLIFRAAVGTTPASVSIGNLAATRNSRYTFIAVDSINRPAPVRLFSINTVTNALAADLTYYNRANGQQISNDQFKALLPAQQANCVSIGTVPASNTDPGGIRFYALTDTYPADAAISAAVTANQSFIRVVHASPNAPAVWVQLTSAGAPITLALNIQNVMSVGGGFSPSVGSRAAGAVGFGTAIATGPASNIYNIEVHTNATFTALALSVPGVSFTPGKIYTIVARGIVGKTGSKGLGAVVIQHN